MSYHILDSLHNDKPFLILIGFDSRFAAEPDRTGNLFHSLCSNGKAR